jgi:hypothetical protein
LPPKGIADVNPIPRLLGTEIGELDLSDQLTGYSYKLYYDKHDTTLLTTRYLLADIAQSVRNGVYERVKGTLSYGPASHVICLGGHRNLILHVRA